jgi:putative ABC transport system ATP-binding protein
VISAESLTKDYCEGSEVAHVLRGVSISLEQGEIVTLEGPSGSGKTTLLSILGCILTATSGTVRVEDQDVDASTPSAMANVRRRSIGFVFQQYNLLPALTSMENVEYALNIKGVKGEEARKEAERVLWEVGLADKTMALPRDMSGGQKQRVAIARALAGRSPVMLVDEPTANLDSQSGSQILELFRRLAKQENRALLIVTHDPKLRSIADRVLQMRDGRLAA